MARPRTTENRREQLLAGRYRLLDRIGAGGMAVVFLAEDTMLDRRVAVKRLHSDAPEDGAKRFHREARLGASLNHPNLVTIFDTVTEDEGVLIVMEYVHGTSLADTIERGPLEPARVVAVLRGVAAGLDHAHAHGVVHRDVKPSNVLIRRDEVVKLADLGVATAAHVSQITTANEIVGTLAYIAPERLDGEEVGGPPADVYALAAVAFEALSGQLAQRGGTPVEILRDATGAPPPDLREAWLDAPAGAAEAIRRGLSADPEARPESASELVAELEAGLGPREPRPMSSPAAKSPGRETPTKVTLSIPRPGRVAAVVGVVAMALGVVAIALSVTGGDETGDSPDASQRAGGERAQADDPARERGGTAGTGSAGEVDPDAGATLNDQGFALMQQGRYEEAVPVLERAVGSYPEGTADLTYAYALYNLGNALRLSGRPDEAIPILERRLEIPNQLGVVRRELEAARAEAAE